ncbi:MAG: ATP synthase F0 subunit B, partial [Planctomycetota bacterium]
MKMRRIMVILWLVLALTVPVMASDPPAESEEGGSAMDNLFGRPGEYVWTLIWFIILMIVLRKFAWKPMLAGLTNRSEHIEKQINDAEKTRADAKQVLEEYNAKLADAERQGRDIITARTKEAEKQ